MTMTLEQALQIINTAWENHDEQGRVILTMKQASAISGALTKEVTEKQEIVS